MFPTGVTEITPQLAFKKEDGRVVYFNGHMPVAAHDENDLPTFRMITSQFYVMGLVSQSDLTRVFGVSPISVKRYVKVLREQGPGGFYAPKRTRGAAVLVSDVVEKAQALLAEGMTVADVAKQLSIAADTLRKGIDSGRVRVKKNAARKEARVAECTLG
jgi:predicted transcriptional regulator